VLLGVCTVERAPALNSEVEGDFGILLLDEAVEALFLVGDKFVCERCCGGEGGEGAEEGREGEEGEHGGRREVVYSGSDQESQTTQCSSYVSSIVCSRDTTRSVDPCFQLSAAIGW